MVGLIRNSHLRLKLVVIISPLQDILHYLHLRAMDLNQIHGVIVMLEIAFE